MKVDRRVLLDGEESKRGPNGNFKSRQIYLFDRSCKWKIKLISGRREDNARIAMPVSATFYGLLAVELQFTEKHRPC